MNIQSCNDEPSRPNPFKRFSIPKVQRLQSKGCRYPHQLKSQQAKEIVTLFTRPFLDQHFRLEEAWHITQVCTVQNDKLLERYIAKKQELREELSKELPETFAFGVTQGEQDADCICGTGDFSKQLLNLPLGRVNEGVNVCSYPDVLLQWADKKEFRQPCIIIYKILKGRCKTVPPRTSVKDPTLDPTPNVECHITNGNASPSEAIFKQFSKSQVFLFEYDEEALPSRQPRHCLPFATISLQSRQAEINKIPYSTSGMLSETGGVGKKMMIHHHSAIDANHNVSKGNLESYHVSSDILATNIVPSGSVTVSVKAGMSQPLKRPLSNPSVEEVEAKYVKGNDKENGVAFHCIKDTKESSKKEKKSCDAGRMKLSDRFSEFATSKVQAIDSRLEELKKEHSRALKKLEDVCRERCNNKRLGASSEDEAKPSPAMPLLESDVLADDQSEKRMCEPGNVPETESFKMMDCNHNDLSQHKVDGADSFEWLKITIDAKKSSENESDSDTDSSKGLREHDSPEPGHQLQKEHPEYQRQMLDEEHLHSPRSKTTCRTARGFHGKHRNGAPSHPQTQSERRGNYSGSFHRDRGLYRGRDYKHSCGRESGNYHRKVDSGKSSPDRDFQVAPSSTSKKRTQKTRQDKTVNEDWEPPDDKDNTVPFFRLHSRNDNLPEEGRIASRSSRKKSSRSTDKPAPHAAIDSLSSYSKSLRFEEVSTDEEDQDTLGQTSSPLDISRDDIIKVQDMDIEGSSTDSGRKSPRGKRKLHSPSLSSFTYSYSKSLKFENVSSDEDEQNAMPLEQLVQNTSGDDMEVKDMDIEENSTDSCRRDSGPGCNDGQQELPSRALSETSSSPSDIDPFSVEEATNMLKQQIQHAKSQEQREVYQMALQSFLEQLNKKEVGAAGKSNHANRDPETVVNEFMPDTVSSKSERSTDVKAVEGPSQDTLEQECSSAGSQAAVQKRPKLLFHGKPLITRLSRREPWKILLETIPGTTQPVDPRAAMSYLYGRKSVGVIDLQMVSWKESSLKPKEPNNVQVDAPEVQKDTCKEGKRPTVRPSSKDPRLLKPKPKRVTNTVQADDAEVQGSSSKEEGPTTSLSCKKDPTQFECKQSGAKASPLCLTNEAHVSPTADMGNTLATLCKQEVTSSPSDFSTKFYQKVKDVIGLDLSCAPSNPVHPKDEEARLSISTPGVLPQDPVDGQVKPSKHELSFPVAEVLKQIRQATLLDATSTNAKGEGESGSVSVNGSSSVTCSRPTSGTTTFKLWSEEYLKKLDSLNVDVYSSFLEKNKRPRTYSSGSNCSNRSSVSVNGSSSVTCSQSTSGTTTFKLGSEEYLKKLDSLNVDVYSSYLEKNSKPRRYSSGSNRSSTSYSSEASHDLHSIPSHDPHYAKTSHVRSPPRSAHASPRMSPDRCESSRRSPIKRHKQSFHLGNSTNVCQDRNSQESSRTRPKPKPRPLGKKPLKKRVDVRRHSAPPRIETDPLLKEVDEKLAVLKYLTHDAISSVSHFGIDKPTFKKRCCNYIKRYNDMWCTLFNTLSSLKDKRASFARISAYELKAAGVHLQLELLLQYVDQSDHNEAGVCNWNIRPIIGVPGQSVAEALILLYRLREDYHQQANPNTDDLLKLILQKKKLLEKTLNPSATTNPTSLPQETGPVLLDGQNSEGTCAPVQENRPWTYPIIRTEGSFYESISQECETLETSTPGPQHYTDAYNSVGPPHCQDIRKVVLTSKTEMCIDHEQQRLASSNPAQQNAEYGHRNI